jgi:hypothetical protein
LRSGTGAASIGQTVVVAGEFFALGGIFLYSIASIMGGAYNPFLYLRF